MLGRSTGQQFAALDAKIDALARRVDEVMARFDGLTADLDRVQRRIEAEATSRRERTGQVSTLRQAVAELHVDHKTTDTVVAKLRGDANAFADAIAALQADGRTTADTLADLRAATDRVGDLQAEGRSAAEAIDRQASLLDELGERDRQRERSLDQMRADVTRIERQAAADLAELRTTNTALARVVLKVDGAPQQHGVTGADPAPVDRGSAGRLDKTADELAAPEAAPLSIVEEEPAERQAAD